MKRKLTITVDEEVLPRAKDAAREKGISLSEYIEGALRELAASAGPKFSKEFRGRFRAAGKDEPRYHALAKKYL